MSSKTPDQMTAEFLKGREDREIAAYPDNLALRVHRAISWIQRAEMAQDDPDIAFTCYWIAFNAAYAEDTADSIETPDRVLFGNYFEKILKLDAEQAIYEAVWDRFSGSVRVMLDNKYVYHLFWKQVNGVGGYGNWESRFQDERARIGKALVRQDTRLILNLLFDRLYVLRNQILHGGATWNSSVNRSQVRDGGGHHGLSRTHIRQGDDGPHGGTVGGKSLPCRGRVGWPCSGLVEVRLHRGRNQ